MGKVLYHTRISVGAGMILNHPGPQELLQEEIDMALAVLPKGTKHISTEQKTIVDLSVPYLITFESECFADGTRIDLEYKRDVIVKPDGDILQFNAFTGVRYFNPDGSEKYND